MGIINLCALIFSHMYMSCTIPEPTAPVIQWDCSGAILLTSVKPRLSVQGISPVASIRTEHVASSAALLTIQQRLSH